MTYLGTINSDDPDVTQVAAALADAAHAGGLSDAYYRKADDALARLDGRTKARIRIDVVDLDGRQAVLVSGGRLTKETVHNLEQFLQNKDGKLVLLETEGEFDMSPIAARRAYTRDDDGKLVAVESIPIPESPIPDDADPPPGWSRYMISTEEGGRCRSLHVRRDELPQVTVQEAWAKFRSENQ